MRRSLLVVCTISGCLTATCVFAQFGSGGGGGFFGQPAQPPAAAEDARPIQLEVTIIDIAGQEAPKTPLTDEQQLNRLERLESEQKLAGIQRMKLNLLSGMPSQLQQGETVQVPVGRTRAPNGDPANRGGFGGPGGIQEITQSRQVGTMLAASARPVAGGAIVDLKLERSGMTAPRPPEAADVAMPLEQPKTRQFTTNTTVMLRDGETKIVGLFQSGKGDGAREETWVLARVTVAAPEKAAAGGIRIFHLKNSSAKDTADMIASIFVARNVRAVADGRTNTLIVVSAPEDEMLQIEAILMKLDESTAPTEGSTTRLVPIPDNAAPLFNPTRSRDPLDQLRPSR